MKKTFIFLIFSVYSHIHTMQNPSDNNNNNNSYVIPNWYSKNTPKIITPQKSFTNPIFNTQLKNSNETLYICQICNSILNRNPDKHWYQCEYCNKVMTGCLITKHTLECMKYNLNH